MWCDANLSVLLNHELQLKSPGRNTLLPALWVVA